MRRGARWLVGLAGTLALAFGLACLNYTRAEGLEHHQAVARRHGLPEPGASIFYIGVAAVVLGAGALGLVLGAGRRD